MSASLHKGMAEAQGSFADQMGRRGVESLRHLPFLSECKELFIDQLAMSLESRIVLAKEIIFSEGSDANELYILRRGRLEALQADGTTLEFIDGAILGNPTALFVQQKRPYTVTATEMSELHVLTRKEFQAIVVLHPNDGARVAHRLEASVCSYRRSTIKAKPADVQHHGNSARASIRASVFNMTTAQKLAAAGPKIVADVPDDREVAMQASGSTSSRRRSSEFARAQSAGKRRSTVEFDQFSLPDADRCSSGSNARPSTARATLTRRVTLPPPTEPSQPRSSSSLSGHHSDHVPPGGHHNDHARSSTADHHVQPSLSSETRTVSGPADHRAKCIKSWAYSVQEDSEASRREHAAWLDTIPFFSKMDAFFLERILHLFEKHRFKLGEHILTEGIAADFLHVVYAGKANVMMNGTCINTIGVKSILGERVILQAGIACKSVASVVVASPVVVTLSLPRAALHMILREDPAVQKQFEEEFDTQKRERGERGFSSLKLFHTCSSPQFATFLEMNLEQRHLPRGTLLFSEGEASHEAFLLCHGTVKVLRKDTFAYEMQTHNFTDAVILGEFNLLGVIALRQATVVAVTECRVHVIFPDSLKKTLDHFPDESVAFRKLVERHTDNAADKLSEHRLNSYLSENGESEDAGDTNKIRQNRMELCLQVSCSCDLYAVSQLASCTPAFLVQLTNHLSPRLYMPQQVVMREGEEMSELHVLQLGSCAILFDGEALATVEAPSLVGSLMSLMTCQVITTVIAAEMCFVGTISKVGFAACLDDHTEDQRRLLELAHDTYKDDCTQFLENLGKDLENKLKSLPMLKDASDEFVSLLAGIVKPRLMLPGQIARDVSEEDGSGVKSPKLYILFEGYCHLLRGNTIVATICKGTIFGEMDVWDLTDCSRDVDMVKTVELCKVGVVEQGPLFQLLSKFPHDRLLLEKLVHNRLEEGVYARIAHQPCFEGLSNQFIQQLCLNSRRRLCHADEYIAHEGAQGDTMFIMNRGKADIFLKGIVLGMLWAGKIFGDGQLLGVTKTYHASLRAKGACHVLELSRKSLTGLAHHGSERQWLTDWQRRAKASLDSDMKVMRRKLREHRRMLRIGLGFLEECSQVFLAGAFSAWHRCVIAEKVDRDVRIKSTVVKRRPDATTAVPSQIDVEAKDYMQSAVPLRFSRGLQRVELELNAAGVTSTNAWRHWGQSGRLDKWKTTRAPTWLSAVREEIPQQLMTLKAEARGASRLPGLMGQN